MESNPYSTPAANLFGDAGSTLNRGIGSVAESTVRVLQKTKPWARFVGILMILYAALIFVVALAAAGMTVAGNGFLEGQANQSPEFRAGAAVGVLLVYGFLGCVFLIPGLKLNGFANRIGLLVAQPTVAHLDAALKQQRGLWKFVGIMMIVGLVIFVLAMGAAIAEEWL